MSALIVSVLIILLVLVSTAIVWYGIQPILRSLGEEDGTGGPGTLASTTTCINANLRIVSCTVNTTNHLISVLIQRGASEGKIDGVKLAFTLENEIRVVNTSLIPEPLETKVYTLVDPELAQASSVDASVFIGGAGCGLTGSPALCSSGQVDETAPLINAANCSNNIDDDGDGFTDYPMDSGCGGSIGTSELGGPTPTETFAFTWRNRNNGPSNLLSVVWYNIYSYGTGCPECTETTAQQLKAQLDALPAGKPKAIAGFTSAEHRRMLFANSSDLDPIDPVTGLPQNCTDAYGTHHCIWWDKGAAHVAQNITNTFTALKNLNASFDYFFIDFESTPSSWSVGSTIGNAQQAARWRAIENDPRFIPIAQKLGFTNLSTVHNWNTPNNINHLLWNVIIKHTTNNYLNIAFTTPLLTLYPNLKISNYASSYNDNILCPFYLEDTNGHGGFCVSNPNLQSGPLIFGNYQGTEVYGWLGQIATRPESRPVPEFDASPFHSFLYTVNERRSSHLNAPTIRDIPWVQDKHYPGFGIDSNLPAIFYSGTDLYEEGIFHILLTDVDSLFYWNELNSSSENNELSGALKEFDAIAGFSDKRTLLSGDTDANPYEPFELVNWTADYILSGMETGGRKVWRFTPNKDNGAPFTFSSNISDFLVAENSTGVYFRTGQSDIFIPQGIIWRPQNPASKQGFWIVQPRNAPNPVETHVNSAPKISISQAPSSYAQIQIFNVSGGLTFVSLNFNVVTYRDDASPNANMTIVPIYQQSGPITATISGNTTSQNQTVLVLLGVSPPSGTYIFRTNASDGRAATSTFTILKVVR